MGFKRNTFALPALIFLWVPIFGSKDYHPGVVWREKIQKWYVQRQCFGKCVYGGYFDDLDDAKHASDDLLSKYEAKNGKNKIRKFNFPQKEKISPIGVHFRFRRNPWRVVRIFDGKQVYGGCFPCVEEAKRASDNLVYEYENKIGKQTNRMLNFPRVTQPQKISKELNNSGTKRMRDGKHKEGN